MGTRSTQIEIGLEQKLARWIEVTQYQLQTIKHNFGFERKRLMETK